MEMRLWTVHMSGRARQTRYQAYALSTAPGVHAQHGALDRQTYLGTSSGCLHASLCEGVCEHLHAHVHAPPCQAQRAPQAHRRCTSTHLPCDQGVAGDVIERSC